MKVNVISNQPPRKLVAVVGERGCGVFFKNEYGMAYYLNFATMEIQSYNGSLEEQLNDPAYTRTPVYVGDKIEIQF